MRGFLVIMFLILAWLATGFVEAHAGISAGRSFSSPARSFSSGSTFKSSSTFKTSSSSTIKSTPKVSASKSFAPVSQTHSVKPTSNPATLKKKSSFWGTPTVKKPKPLYLNGYKKGSYMYARQSHSPFTAWWFWFWMWLID